jgi:hypothetical protein
MRPALLDLVAQVLDHRHPEDAEFLAQLRAAVAVVDTPIDRLFARYRGRASLRPLLYAGHRD